ncbi:hypothetical protein Gotri_023837 [Gossypium trilobum]|uniref:Uncharacterized protein n=1 Tax=Gossypium trilobum TaxID=34281 RepID=A0A7J9DKQ5_9ROSI|nr:hypothetical protein [Gossypium trilobum]
MPSLMNGHSTLLVIYEIIFLSFFYPSYILFKLPTPI